MHLLAFLDDEGQLAADGGISIDHDGDAEALLERAQMGALVVEQIERDLRPGAHGQIMGCSFEQHFLERTQELERHRRYRAHVASAATVWAFVRRALKHTRADALTRHFKQPEMRDVSDLDARAVVPQAFLQPPFDRAVVALLVHVDEVDDDQPGEIAQTQLPGDLLGGFEIGLERGVLDVVLARGATRIDVDRDQRFRLIEHDIAARTQLHYGREHRIELTFDAVTGEDRQRFTVGFHVLAMARHEHAHELLCLRIGIFPCDQDLVDVLVVEIANGALDERPFLVDERRRRRFEREVTHRLPESQQVFEVTFDLGFGAARASRPQNYAHAFRDFQLLRDVLQPPTIFGARDLAANAAAARGVWHQHRIAAGKGKIGGQRCALGATLLLDHLHQHHLPTLDDLLDLVLTAHPRHALRHLFQRIGPADRLHNLLLAFGTGTIDFGDVGAHCSGFARFVLARQRASSQLVRLIGVALRRMRFALGRNRF